MVEWRISRRRYRRHDERLRQKNPKTLCQRRSESKEEEEKEKKVGRRKGWLYMNGLGLFE
jgi:hypothetical protein